MNMQLRKFSSLNRSEELVWKGPQGGGLPCTPAVGINT